MLQNVRNVITSGLMIALIKEIMDKPNCLVCELVGEGACKEYSIEFLKKISDFIISQETEFFEKHKDALADKDTVYICELKRHLRCQQLEGLCSTLSLIAVTSGVGLAEAVRNFIITYQNTQVKDAYSQISKAMTEELIHTAAKHGGQA